MCKSVLWGPLVAKAHSGSRVKSCIAPAQQLLKETLRTVGPTFVGFSKTLKSFRGLAGCGIQWGFGFFFFLYFKLQSFGWLFLLSCAQEVNAHHLESSGNVLRALNSLSGFPICRSAGTGGQQRSLQ